MATEILSIIATTMQMVSRLRDINKNIENAEFSNALADLSLELAKLKAELANVIDENTNLKAQLAIPQLHRQPLEFKCGAYYQADGDGPFCSGCYDSRGTIIRLTKAPSEFKDMASHFCPVCNAVSGGP